MSLPADGVNANALTETTTIPTGKKLIFLDPDTNEGGIITLENLTKQILSNLATQTFNLDQGTKTLLAALNELNSNQRLFQEQAYVTGKIKDCNDIPGGSTVIAFSSALHTPIEGGRSAVICIEAEGDQVKTQYAFGLDDNYGKIKSRHYVYGDQDDWTPWK